MATRKALRPVDHEAQLSLVEHLDELRSRLVVSLAVLIALFAICFWQNDTVLDIVNRPLEQTAFKKDQKGKSKDPLEQAAVFQQLSRDALIADAKFLREIAAGTEVSAETRALARAAASRADIAAAAAPEKRENMG